MWEYTRGPADERLAGAGDRADALHGRVVRREEEPRMILTSWNRYRDIGLLIVRVGLGAMFIWHGWPKIAGGAAEWGKLGMAVGNLGIHFAPAFWGFMAAFAEFGGGILLVLGFFFRPACMLLVIDMVVAMTFHLSSQDPVLHGQWWKATEDGIVFLGLILIGPGKYALDGVLRRETSRAA
jgi:putative oxidoreductase